MMTVEKKQGVSQLELVCEEIRIAELAKQQKREHKRQKRRRRKNRLKAATVDSKQLHVFACDDVCKDYEEQRSGSVSPSSTTEENENPFVVFSCNETDLSSIQTHPSPGSAVLHQCSCSSNQYLSDVVSSCCVDCGYFSGSANNSPCSSSPSSWASSSDGTCADSFYNHEDDCQNCSWPKPTRTTCDSHMLGKCQSRDWNNGELEYIHDETSISTLSLGFRDDIIMGSLQLITVPIPLSLEDLLKKSCPSDEEVYIPPEELRELRAKVRQASQARLKFRENLKQRFQYLHMLTKFRFRPFAFH